MTQLTYQWERYWYPRGLIPPSPANGFLYISRFNSSTDNFYLQMEELESIPCLILLGEPGIGKSFALEKAYQIRENSLSPNEVCHKINLREFGEHDLTQKLDNEIFHNWSATKDHLYLYFDSLDEARARISTIIYAIIRRLEKFVTTIPRISLRIACRTSDWLELEDVENKLKKFWSEENDFQVYELAPLQRNDVNEAALANGFEPAEFMQEIIKNELEALAAVPITLDLLIHTYIPNQPLSTSRNELYRRGCLELCRESEQAHRQYDNLVPEQRMIVAERIAACTLLTNHFEIILDSNLIENPENESEFLTINDLVGGRERFNDEAFPVGEDAIRETLSTGLFRGGNKRVWVHQTYAEYLAAMYIKDLTLRQISGLIFQDGKLVPQLQGVSAWIASMHSGIFNKILSAQPEILLRSNIATSSIDAKSNLTKGLLDQIEVEGWPLDTGIFRWFSKLNHPGIEQIIQPYIEDQSKPIQVRLAAIQLAEECQLTYFQNMLSDFALDCDEDSNVRYYATVAIAKIGDADTKAKLKTLALIPLDEIVNRETDRLKDFGIQAVWPEHISVEELFESLPSAQKIDYIYRGNYLPGFVPQHLSIHDFPIALTWVAQLPRRLNLTYSLPDLMDEIMLHAWEFIDDHNVLLRFCEAAYSRLIKHDLIVGEEGSLKYGRANKFRNLLQKDHDKRRAVLMSLLPHIVEFNSFIYQIINAPLVTADDSSWLIEKYREAGSEEEKQIFTRLIELILWRYPQQFEGIYEACQTDSSLEAALGHPFNQIRLDSEQALRRKSEKEESRKWEQEQAEKQNQILDPTPKERTLSFLESCEAGSAEEWWHIPHWMRILPNGSHEERIELNMDLERYPVWQQLDIFEKRRVLETAKTYIVSFDPEIYDWPGENTVYRPVTAGYKAFRLLLSYEPEFLMELSSDKWEKWAAVLLYYLEESGHPIFAVDDPDQVLIRLAYAQAPEAIYDALLRLIDLENARESYSVVRWTTVFWDVHLAQVLFNKAHDETLRPNYVAQLLHQLLTHRYQQAEEFAKSLVVLPLPPDGRERDLAIVAAVAILLSSVDDAWETVWPIFQVDNLFGREVISNIAHQYLLHPGKFGGDNLKEAHLARLYKWLVHQYPPNEDPEHSGSVTVRHEISRLRNDIREILVHRGSRPAIIELQQLANESPELNLHWYVKRAQERYHSETWSPPSPDNILDIAKDKEKGLVENGEHLLELINESLGRLQEKLQGKHSAVIDLWNEMSWSQVKGIAETLPDIPHANFEGEDNSIANLWQSVSWRKIQKQKHYFPRDELYFSNYVARHLQELQIRAIVVNREVEIQHGNNRTDIYIEAFKRDATGVAYDLITVVIEVKGCWHKEVERAMETQLMSQYLGAGSSGASHGLYLVGLFNCSKWHLADWRNQKCQKYDSNSLTTVLNAQADELSRNGVKIIARVLDLSLP